MYVCKMEAITLTNPKGQQKDFTNVEFYEFKDVVSKSKSFDDWAKKSGTGPYVKYNGATYLNIGAIERFLNEKGYTWKENFRSSDK